MANSMRIFLKILVVFSWLVLGAGCLPFWPWGYAAKTVEEEVVVEEEVIVEEGMLEPQTKTAKKIKPSYITRIITRKDKGFDYNQDGIISAEEAKFYKRAAKIREAEKQVTGGRGFK